MAYPICGEAYTLFKKRVWISMVMPDDYNFSYKKVSISQMGREKVFIDSMISL